ncbi:MAG: hypothetical protein HAW67_06170 [Endozoicomonadaceae bacterium]|nr:hypothetical protein [Endozoicomonadaceae bacterium]
MLFSVIKNLQSDVDENHVYTMGDDSAFESLANLDKTSTIQDCTVLTEAVVNKKEIHGLFFARHYKEDILDYISRTGHIFKQCHNEIEGMTRQLCGAINTNPLIKQEFNRGQKNYLCHKTFDKNMGYNTVIAPSPSGKGLLRIPLLKMSIAPQLISVISQSKMFDPRPHWRINVYLINDGMETLYFTDEGAFRRTLYTIETAVENVIHYRQE